MTDSNPVRPDTSSPNAQPTANPTDQLVDPRDVVYNAEDRLTTKPKELVENPAVTPEMLNEPGDLRMDVQEDD